MKYKFLTTFSIFAILCIANFSFACISQPKVYELTNDLSIEVSAGTRVILKGKKSAPHISYVQTDGGAEFSLLKEIQGVKWYEDQRTLLQRMKNLPPYGKSEVFKENWTEIILDQNKDVDFPLELFLKI